MNTYDAVVIGAGPAGLTAALYLVRSGVKTALIEKTTAGGQVMGTAEIENYPGFPKGVKGWELSDLFAAHLEGYPLDHIHAEVESLELDMEQKNPHRLNFAEGRESILAATVVVASGATHRHLGAPGEGRLIGKGVSYCAVCDGNFYAGQDVAVIGGGNSAFEESLYLSRIVNKIYLIHRREGFRCTKVYEDKVRAMPDKIELITSSVVESMNGADQLESITLHNVQTGQDRVIPVSGLFVYVGMAPNTAFLPSLLDTDEGGFIKTDQEMNTNVPGLYAAGDIRAKNCRQISSAVGDGATAATAALSYLEQLNA